MNEREPQVYEKMTAEELRHAIAQPLEEDLRPVEIEGLTEGRIVHYVTDIGRHRPAMIVQVWNKTLGTSNLQVFTDGRNDGFPSDVGLTWITSIDHSIVPRNNTWHFIERA